MGEPPVWTDHEEDDQQRETEGWSGNRQGIPPHETVPPLPVHQGMNRRNECVPGSVRGDAAWLRP